METLRFGGVVFVGVILLGLIVERTVIALKVESRLQKK